MAPFLAMLILLCLVALTLTTIPSFLVPSWPAIPSWLPRWPLKFSSIVLLADLQGPALRTVLTGTTTWLDALVISPGLHRQKDAGDLSKGEYPACAAMTTGYVFRVENEACVCYMQRVGRTGCLTTLSVTAPRDSERFQDGPVYCLAAIATLTSMSHLYRAADWTALTALCMLITARLINVFVLRRRAEPTWKGAPEPGKKSDLIVLLSRDRWVRIRGATDDVKAITSGAWLREHTDVEEFFTATATLMVYLAVAVACTATDYGSTVLLLSFIDSAFLLGVANDYSDSDSQYIYGRQVKVEGARRKYSRRLQLAEELVAESGRKDWAIRLGMIQADAGTEDAGPKVM